MRIFLGWKHCRYGVGGFTLIQTHRGGGLIPCDIYKDGTEEEIEEVAKKLFFPNGINVSQNVLLAETTYFLGSFSGSHLPKLLENGDPFNLQGYCADLHTNPVRVYLHTIEVCT